MNVVLLRPRGIWPSLIFLSCALSCGGSASTNEERSETGGDGPGYTGGNGDGDSSGGGTSNSGGSSSGGTQSGGADTGGAETGGSSTGGGDTGGAATGGSETGGQGGDTGGAPPGVHELGEQCDAPGTLGCVGTFQRVSLFCDADGEWSVNETCGGEEVCDTGAIATGTCQDQVPECLGKSPGETFCSGWDVHACGVDNVDSQLVQECGEGCVDGECFPTYAPCPELGDTLHDCSNSCQAEDYWCDVDEQTQCQFSKVHGNGVVRIPAASTLCEGPADCPELKMFVVNFVPGDPTYFKVNLPPDWSGVLLDGPDYTSITHRAGACGVEPLTGCVVLEPQFLGRSLALIPNTPDSAERNIVVEYSLEPLTCP